VHSASTAPATDDDHFNLAEAFTPTPMVEDFEDQLKDLHICAKNDQTHPLHDKKTGRHGLLHSTVNLQFSMVGSRGVWKTSKNTNLLHPIVLSHLPPNRLQALSALVQKHGTMQEKLQLQEYLNDPHKVEPSPKKPKTSHIMF